MFFGKERMNALNITKSLPPYYPHQVEAAAKGTAQGCIGLFMGMRTGKTRTAIEIARRLSAFPCLVIAPLGVLATWETELGKEGYSPDEIRIVRAKAGRPAKSAKDRFLSPRPKFFLLNYDNVEKLDALNLRSEWEPERSPVMDIMGIPRPWRAPEWAGLEDWRGVVVDESYRLANHENSLTKYLLTRPFPGIQNQHRICLSGTPAAESPFQYAPQFIFMEGSFFGCTDPEVYRHTFWDWNPYLNKWTVKDPRHLDEIRAYVQARAYCVTMEELGLGCEVLQTTREVIPNKAQIELLQWLKYATTYEHPESGDLTKMEPVVRVIFAQKIAAGLHPLTDEIVSEDKINDFIEYWETTRQPLLVSSKFNAPIFRAVERCKEKGIRATSIVGDDSAEAREEKRLAFQAGKIDILIGQETVIYAGLEFSGLGDILVMSSGHSAQTREQLEERGQHVNRKIPYQVISQHMQKSIDESITKVLTYKKQDARYYLKQLENEVFTLCLA